MRPLKPLTLLVGGPLLLAIAVAICAAVAQPGVRDARGVAIFLVVGLVLGMLMFGPIAAAEAFVETVLSGWWTTGLEVLPPKERAAGRF